MCEHQSQLNNIERTLGNLEGTVAKGFKNVEERLDRMDKRQFEQEKEIDGVKLEQAQIKGKGAILAVFGSAAIGIFATLVTILIQDKLK